MSLFRRHQIGRDTLSNPPNPVVTHPLSWRTLWSLRVLALGMILPAVYFGGRYPLRSHSHELADLGILSDYTRGSFMVFVALILVWFAVYILGIRATRHGDQRLALGIVLLTAAVCGGSLAFMYPTNATDVYMYAVRSRLFTEYGANPIATTPNEYSADAWHRYIAPEWADDTSPYGPAWNIIAEPITLLAGDRIGVALAGFKILALLCYLATGWLIARVLALSPGTRPAQGALLFLWNPLVLWEGIGNAHNDLLVTLLLVLAVYAWQRGHVRWVVPALVVAAMVKFFALLLIPLAVVAIWRRTPDWFRAAEDLLRSAAISLLTIAVGFAPFYDLHAVIASARRQADIAATSLATAAANLLRDDVARPTVLSAAQQLGLAIVLLLLIVWVIALWMRPVLMPYAFYSTLFVFVLVAAPNFRSWYLIWIIGLAAVLPTSRAAWRIVAWSSGSMAAYALLIWVWHWWRAPFFKIENVTVLLIFGPVLAVLVAEALAQDGKARARKTRSAA